MVPIPRAVHRSSDIRRRTPSTASARLLAVKILLAAPELLGHDALETDLYILRENLRTGVQATVSAGTSVRPRDPRPRLRSEAGLRPLMSGWNSIGRRRVPISAGAFVSPGLNHCRHGIPSGWSHDAPFAVRRPAHQPRHALVSTRSRGRCHVRTQHRAVRQALAQALELARLQVGLLERLEQADQAGDEDAVLRGHAELDHVMTRMAEAEQVRTGTLAALAEGSDLRRPGRNERRPSMPPQRPYGRPSDASRLPA